MTRCGKKTNNNETLFRKRSQLGLKYVEYLLFLTPCHKMQLTYFSPVHIPTAHEIVRKPKVFWRFQGV